MNELDQAIQGYQRLIDSAATNASRQHYQQLVDWLLELSAARVQLAYLNKKLWELDCNDKN